MKQKVLLILLITISVYSDSFGCICTTGTSNIRDYNNNDIIFYGRVVYRNIDPLNTYVTFRVLKLYKGNITENFVHITGNSNYKSGCGIFMRIGEIWLVYGQSSINEIITSGCTTQRDNEDKFTQDTIWLNNIKKDYTYKLDFKNGINGEGNLVEGKPIGKWIYFQDSTMSKSIVYIYNSSLNIDSITKFKFTKGYSYDTCIYVFKYKNAIPNSDIYYKQNCMYSFERINNGIINEISYFSNGKVRTITSYKIKRRDVKMNYIEYYENGTIKEKGTFNRKHKRKSNWKSF